MASRTETGAMRRALALAATPGVPLGPNPRVGCVLLAPDGTVVAEGFHRGAGSPHAEAAALAVAGSLARGSTAVVTLEPCAHTGRTGPCADALLAAGVARVVFAQSDPNPVAAGGADRLRHAGVDVEPGLLADEAASLNEVWTFAMTRGRPFVTWKTATTLDGRVAAPDGSSRWITSNESRAEVHALRALVDAVVVGTGTALADDPALTVRDPDGTPAQLQPLRVVVGRRPLPPGARLLDDSAPTLVLGTHDPAEVLATLREHDVQHVLLEGGPTLAGAFVEAGLVDAVRWYLAPAVLGAGPEALVLQATSSITDLRRWRLEGLTRVGPDVRLDLTPKQEDDL